MAPLPRGCFAAADAPRSRPRRLPPPPPPRPLRLPAALPVPAGAAHATYRPWRLRHRPTRPEGAAEERSGRNRLHSSNPAPQTPLLKPCTSTSPSAGTSMDFPALRGVSPPGARSAAPASERRFRCAECGMAPDRRTCSSDRGGDTHRPWQAHGVPLMFPLRSDRCSEPEVAPGRSFEVSEFATHTRRWHVSATSETKTSARW